ncbi:MAG: hypothetical protein GC200_08910 [Tepidisphaera sp.]|nr:hypothetical protein [Tepidisphaera sp.]
MNWIGVGPTSGPQAANNWSGVGGVSPAQPAPSLIAGDPRYPAFQPGADVVVFKFGFAVGDSGGSRDLTIDTPARGLYHEGGSNAPPALFGKTKSLWYLSASDISAMASYDSTGTEAAFVHVVPEPGVVMLAIAVGLGASRRRR